MRIFDNGGETTDRYTILLNKDVFAKEQAEQNDIDEIYSILSTAIHGAKGDK